MTQIANNPSEVDVVVVGGGIAGLSGAVTLARSRRSVVVVDSGEPRNEPASGVHGLLSRDGIAPGELLRTGRAEVEAYGGRVVTDRAVSARRDGDGFLVETAQGRRYRARRLLVATGLADRLPDVDGLRERWGRDVLHCPYCHGWEVRDEPIGVLATGPMAVHQALLFRQLSDRVTLFRHTAGDLAEEEWEKLAARGIDVVEGEVAAVEVEDDRLAGVRLASGRRFPLRALAVAPRFEARDEVLAGLDLAAAEHPMGIGNQVEAQASGMTSVPGVWVAGNVADVMDGVPAAAAAGVKAAAAVNADLVAADTDAAVARRRSGNIAEVFGAAAEAAVCERVLGERRHGLDGLLSPRTEAGPPRARG
ncbi:NAD(P)/FAD-dependent oxidoreductase [Streptomyces vilmorinianum]|uniref:NAD(P)/FAD-dependent oxidoreductase n=1 Tax=Streptomyces vilmorinianum TaxID=3051092 RepID=UPI0010FB160F|nr:NAD(P)/FAD-dependent oxidoreductase [Streptomyces vilmorinianum]